MEYLIGCMILLREIWQEVGLIFIRGISRQREVQYGILCGSYRTAERAEADESLQLPFSVISLSVQHIAWNISSPRTPHAPPLFFSRAALLTLELSFFIFVKNKYLLSIFEH